MLLGYVGISTLSQWVQRKLDDVTYGYPRVSQLDAEVGHNGRVSHFIALNLHGEMSVIETQKGHPEATKIYPIESLPADQDYLPVTISVQDLNADGKPDLLVRFGDNEIPMYNNGTGFQAQPPASK
jgi:hypothetical protein